MIKSIEQSTQGHYKKLIQILGRKYIRGTIDSPYDFIHIAAHGLDANIINNFREYFKISMTTAAQMLDISEPTLYRWTKSNKKLDRNFSVKLFEIADLFLNGIEIFGSKENFFKWLYMPNTALGGMEPNQLIEIPAGVSKVKDLLGRIEYGVYS